MSGNSGRTDGSDDTPRVPEHEAVDRFGRSALRAAHDLGAALAGDDADHEPVVLRRGGPHRSLDALAARLDAVLAEEEAPARHDGRGAEDGTTGPAEPDGTTDPRGSDGSPGGPGEAGGSGPRGRRP